MFLLISEYYRMAEMVYDFLYKMAFQKYENDYYEINALVKFEMYYRISSISCN